MTDYGALARAMALTAGYHDWMRVTRWPVDDGETDHCSCCAHRRGYGCGGPDCACDVEARNARTGTPSWGGSDWWPDQFPEVGSE